MLPPIAFIGGGNMATAIITGLESLNAPPPITVIDVSPEARARHQAAGRGVADSMSAIAGHGIVMLAVKPQVIATVLETLSPLLEDQLLISILAGTPCATIETAASESRVVRAMPNTPMAIGKGMVGLCPGSRATEDDLTLAEAVFAPAASVLRCSEERMNAITAVSGSGPAYFFHFCEALHAAAMERGFSADEAALLVGQTGEGALAYLRSQDGFPAAQLRQQVTSPGGTTAAALDVFAAHDFMSMISKAVAAAENRGRELAG